LPAFSLEEIGAIFGVLENSEGPRTVDTQTAGLEHRVILRQDELLKIYGLSRNALIRAMRDEGMPQPIKLSPRRKGWFAREVEEWFANRPRGIAPTKR
jgi:predicted DNA-binding transcriptional regulator AlpA